MEKVDIAIIGGGAAGLSAAVFACREAKRRGRPSGRRYGKKRRGRARSCWLPETAPAILQTAGRSRGAITAWMPERRKSGGGVDPSPVSPEEARRFFASIGLESAEKDRGRVYPLSAQAGAVLDCLRLAMAAEGVPEHCGQPVSLLRERGGTGGWKHRRGLSFPGACWSAAAAPPRRRWAVPLRDMGCSPGRGIPARRCSPLLFRCARRRSWSSR